MDDLTEFLSREIAHKKYVSDCPVRAYAKYTTESGEHISPAVTIAHSGAKPEGDPFAWYAETAKIAVDEFARVMNEFTANRAWGYRRHPEVAEKEHGFVCTARVFVFNKAKTSSEVSIVDDDR